MTDSKPPVYGDFPTLFEGLPADEVVDLDHSLTSLLLTIWAEREVLERLYPGRKEAEAENWRRRKEEARALVEALGR